MVYRPTDNTRRAAEGRRARIITTAWEHIGDVGWQQFNCHTVAKRMGVGVGTIYTYFPTIHELVESAMGLLAHADMEGMKSVHPDPVIRLTRAIRMLLNRSNQIRVNSGLATHPHYRAIITRVLEEDIADCARAGIIERINPSLLASAVYGMIFNVLASDPSPSEYKIRQVQAMALRIVGADVREPVA